MANSAVVGILKAMLTADTSNYEAGMRKATTTAQQTEKAIGGLGKEVTKITPQAERMVKAFGGDKLLYQANNLAASITKIGGASRLTEAEQARANATITQAIAKYQALGKEAPAALLELQRQTKAQVGLLDSFKAALGPIGPTLIATFSASAIIGFGKSLVDLTGHISDLSAQTGVGVERIQALDFVGVKANVTFDDMARGMEQLASRVGSGEKSAVNALGRLHISVQSIKNDSLDESFIRIGEAIAKIQNPLERIRIERELFGRQGALYGRIFTEDFRKVVEEAEHSGAVINKELIERADAFGDFWAQAWLRFKAGSVTAVGAAVDALKQFQFASEGISLPIEPPAPGSSLPNVGRPNLAMPSRFVTLPQEATEKEIAALERQSKAILEALKHAEELRRVTEALFSKDVIERTSLYAEALGRVENLSRLTAEKKRELRKAVLDALSAYKALGQTAPEALTRIAEATATLEAKQGDLKLVMQAVAEQAHTQNVSLIEAASGMDALYEASARAKDAQDRLAKGGFITPNFGMESEDVTEEARHFEREMSDVAKAVQRDFMDMAQDVADAFGDMLVHARSFKDGMLDIFRSLQRGIANILGDMLKQTVSNVLGRALGMGGNGGGGGGGGLFGNAASVAGLFGGGGGVSSSFLASAPGLGASGSGIVAGEGIGSVGAAGAGGGGGAAGGFLMNPAFWTNPYTIAAIAGTALLTWGITKKGWFRGGEQGVVTNPKRDSYFGQFVSMFGGSPHEAIVKAHQRAHVSAGATDSAIKALYAAHSYKDFQAAEHRDINLLAAGGLRGIKAFNVGGFIPPGVTQPAMLHGGGMGELIVPLQKLAEMRGRSSAVFNFNIGGVLDRDSVRMVFRQHIIPEIKNALAFNTDDFTTAHRREFVT